MNFFPISCLPSEIGQSEIRLRNGHVTSESCLLQQFLESSVVVYYEFTRMSEKLVLSILNQEVVTQKHQSKHGGDFYAASMKLRLVKLKTLSKELSVSFQTKYTQNLCHSCISLPMKHSLCECFEILRLFIICKQN